MKTILVTILWLIAIVMTAFGAYASRHRRSSPCAPALVHLLFTLAAYSGGYAAELSSTTLSGMLFWNTFEYLGISFLPTFWILFTARYVNARWITKKRALVIMLAISASTLIGVLTDPVLHLRYASSFVRIDGPFPTLGFTRGPIYWTHTAYSFASLAIGSVLLSRIMFMTAPGFFRRQQLLMLAGACLPWINYVLYLFGVTVWGIDTIPFSCFLSAVCFGAAIFGYRVLDVVPVARGIVFEMMSDGAIVLDTADRIVDYNRTAASVFPELCRSSLSEDCSRILFEHRVLASRIADPEAVEFQFTAKTDIGIRHYQCKISGIMSRSDSRIGKLILFKDNTDSALLMEKLQELATMDPLTRIFNRRHFIELANRQIDYLARVKRPFSIAILDLDFFKHVNDTYGHLVGDEVLKSVATVLSTGLRGCDFVARFGGEEFIFFLSETVGADAFETVERLREAIRKTRVVLQDAPEISVSASFGLYCVESGAAPESIDSCIAHADAALYRAKESGRNRTVLYGPGM